MALILKNNVIYLHIPKTGGNWLTKLLLEQNKVKCSIGHKHSTFDYLCGLGIRLSRRGIKDAVNMKRHLSDAPTVVCVVRNPLKWYESWYKYQIGTNMRRWGENGSMKEWHVVSDLNDLIHDDFNEYMRKVNKFRPGYVGALFSKYASNSSAYVLKNEDMPDALSEFSDVTGIELDLASARNSGRYGVSPNIAIRWDKEVLEQTIEYERACFDRYGYSAENVVDQA